jgi:tetratricopeptide (TPR) repeat protein
MAKSKKQKEQQRFESRLVSVCADGSGVMRQLSVGQSLEIARALARRGSYSGAAQLACAVALQVPKYIYPLNLAADCYLLLENLVAAEQAIESALAINKTDWATLRAHASLYRQLGRYEEAIDVMTRAIKMHPGNEVLYENFGTLYSEMGDYKKAVRCYSAALKCNPQATTTMRLKTDLPGGALSAREVAVAEKMLRSESASNVNRRNLHFAIAQTRQQAGDSDRQIYHLHAANKAHRDTLSHNTGQESAALDFISSAFAPNLFSSVDEGASRGGGLIFIVGMPRSGSSLVEQILSSHPDVSAAGESNALSLALDELSPGKGWMVAVRELFLGDTQVKLKQLGDSYLRRTESFRTCHFMTDKTLGNYYFLGLIPLIFPGARIVHTIRHPIDNCFGCYRRLFNGSSWSYAYDLNELAAAYTCYQGMMRHWQQLFSSRVFNLEYEELVSNQKATTRAALRHCGLEWDDRCLDFTGNSRGVRTNSSSQIRSGLNSKGIGQWELFREHLEPLISLQPFGPEEIRNQATL